VSTHGCRTRLITYAPPISAVTSWESGGGFLGRTRIVMVERQDPESRWEGPPLTAKNLNLVYSGEAVGSRFDPDAIDPPVRPRFSVADAGQSQLHVLDDTGRRGCCRCCCRRHHLSWPPESARRAPRRNARRRPQFCPRARLPSRGVVPRSPRGRLQVCKHKHT